MTRVKRGSIRRKKHKKILKVSEGFKGSSSSLFRVANQGALKALKTSYFLRRLKKRDFRRVWISRINAEVKASSLRSQNYSLFMSKVKASSSALNRKILATLAVKDHLAFEKIQDSMTNL